MCFCNMAYSADDYVCFYSDGTRLMQSLDNKFKSFISGLDYKEYHIPAIIDGEVLRKCDYFSSFPHHLTVAAFVRKECCDDVIAKKTVNKEHLETADKYLTPAACLHIYPMLEGKKDIKNSVITTKARVYRFEEGRFKELTRLWDFTVREIVIIGEHRYVEELMTTIRDQAVDFAKKISVDSELTTASDSFYPTRQNIIKSKIQKVNSLKYELLIPIKDEKVAVASFNFHDTHFSKPFNFDNEGEIVTGCVGFGLERWVAACLDHKFNFSRD